MPDKADRLQQARQPGRMLAGPPAREELPDGGPRSHTVAEELEQRRQA